MSRLKSTAMLLLIMLPISAYTQTTCDQTLQMCNRVVQEQQKQIQIRDLRIKQDEDQLKNVTEERDSAEHALNAWYRNPLFWGVVGFGLGIYVMKK